MKCILQKLFNKIRENALSNLASSATNDQKHRAIIKELESNMPTEGYAIDISIDYVLGITQFADGKKNAFINKYFPVASASASASASSSASASASASSVDAEAADTMARAAARYTYFTSGCPDLEAFAGYLRGLRDRRRANASIPSMRFKIRKSKDEQLIHIDIIDSAKSRGVSDFIKYHFTIGVDQAYNLGGTNYSNTYHLTDLIAAETHTYYDLYDDTEININTRKVTASGMHASTWRTGPSSSSSYRPSSSSGSTAAEGSSSTSSSSSAAASAAKTDLNKYANGESSVMSWRERKKAHNEAKRKENESKKGGARRKSHRKIQRKTRRKLRRTQRR
jgi:hypothetical protein